MSICQCPLGQRHFLEGPSIETDPQAGCTAARRRSCFRSRAVSAIETNPEAEGRHDRRGDRDTVSSCATCLLQTDSLFHSSDSLLTATWWSSARRTLFRTFLTLRISEPSSPFRTCQVTEVEDENFRFDSRGDSLGSWEVVRSFFCNGFAVVSVEQLSLLLGPTLLGLTTASLHMKLVHKRSTLATKPSLASPTESDSDSNACASMQKTTHSEDFLVMV